MEKESPLSRENLAGSDYNPIDPAFRSTQNDEPKKQESLPSLSASSNPAATPTPPDFRSQDPQPMEENSYPNKTLIIVVVIIVIFLLAGATLFMFSQGNSENPVEDPLSPPINNAPLLKAVYLGKEESITTQFKALFPQISFQPEEISFYNEKNLPMSLEEFSTGINIFIPNYVKDNLNPQYHFLLAKTSPDFTPQGILILKTKTSDPAKISELMRRWENYLTEDLKNFILFGEETDFVTPRQSIEAFRDGSSVHGSRYINFTDNGGVSLNYFTVDDKIVFTNNFEVLKTAVDYVKINRDL